MNCGINSEKQLQEIEQVLTGALIDNGVACALLIDTAGNTVAERSDGKNRYDTYAFAALAAGNFATVDSMAKLVGEREFAQLFHKGENVSIFFSKVNDDLLLITIFGSEVTLGFLRLKIAELRQQINSICQVVEAVAP
ncbi:MAG: roadblock/LC7 domain-containing protein [Thermodesulfobacteriota bacterium]